MTPRGRVVAASSVVGLILLGLAAALILDGRVATFLTILFVSVAIVVSVSLVFYEVGLSEDRDREREQQRRR